MQHDAPDIASPSARVDDCWNRIGTRGDNTCPRLAVHTRCLNCPVFAQGAARLLDGPLSDADLMPRADAATRHERAATGITTSRGDASTQAALAFRIAGEWLALPVHLLREVDDVRSIHSLPHRRSRAVLGVVNVRGALTVAVSLGELLNIERTGDARASARNGYARMLVAAHGGGPAASDSARHHSLHNPLDNSPQNSLHSSLHSSLPVAFPVDEVEGVVRFAQSALLPVPATLAHTTAFHARGVLAWRDRTIGLLDAERLFDSIARSLR